MLMSLLSATLSPNFLLGDLQTEKIGRYYSPSAPLKALFCSTIMHRGIQHQSRYHKLLNTKKPSDGFLEGSDWAGLNHAQLQL